MSLCQICGGSGRASAGDALDPHGCTVRCESCEGLGEIVVRQVPKCLTVWLCPDASCDWHAWHDCTDWPAEPGHCEVCGAELRPRAATRIPCSDFHPEFYALNEQGGKYGR